LVGDIIKVEPGKRLPADVVLIEAEEIECDESDLTGEAKHRSKDILTEENRNKNPCPFMFKGTICVNGSGKAIVVAVGQHTNTGKQEKENKFE
jgi:P-type Ca2+ transporter type 2C